MLQALLGGDAEQAAGHFHGGENRNAALKQDTQGAIEPRQFIHHQAPVQGRQALQLTVQPTSHPWVAAHHEQAAHEPEKAKAQRRLVSMQKHPGLHQPPREPRQFGAQALKYQAETWHHITEQKQHYTATDQ
ncbi:hypothetical protein D3C79_804400 [compost metagenome]